MHPNGGAKLHLHLRGGLVKDTVKLSGQLQSTKQHSSSCCGSWCGNRTGSMFCGKTTLSKCPRFSSLQQLLSSQSGLQQKCLSLDVALGLGEARGLSKLQGFAFFVAAHPFVSQCTMRKHETKQCIQILICLKGAKLHLHLCGGPVRRSRTSNKLATGWRSG